MQDDISLNYKEESGPKNEVGWPVPTGSLLNFEGSFSSLEQTIRTEMAPKAIILFLVEDDAMVPFVGDKDFPQPPAELWRKLSDVRFLVPCIPGVEKVSQLEPTQAACVLRPGFSFVRGTLELTIQLVEAIEPSLIRFAFHGKGIGSSNQVEAVLNIASHDAGSRVHWTAEIKELGGLLKAVPQGLIRAAAQKVVEDAWKKVEEMLT